MKAAAKLELVLSLDTPSPALSLASLRDAIDQVLAGSPDVVDRRWDATWSEPPVPGRAARPAQAGVE